MKKPASSVTAVVLATALVSVACGGRDDTPVSQEEGSEGSGDGSSDGSTGAQDDSTGGDTTGDAGDNDTSGSEASEGTTGEPGLPPPQEAWRVSSTWGSTSAICLHGDNDVVMVGSRATSIDPGAAYVQAVSADGELGWRTEIGDPQGATYFYEVACAPDRTVYAVGVTSEGDGVWQLPQPIIVALDGDTGSELWSLVPGGDLQEGELFGAHADDSGVYVVGWRDASSADFGSPYVAHYTPGGAPSWAHNAPIEGDAGTLYAVRRHGDLLFVAGSATGDNGFEDHAWIAALSPDGQPQWSETHAWGDRAQGYFLALDPESDGVLVAGTVEQQLDDLQWVMPCGDAGCDGEPQELTDLRDFYGFAVDHRGQWLAADAGSVHARIPGGDIAWTYDTGLFQEFHVQLSTLAVDSTGAILVGGEMGPPTLVKLVAADDAPR
jgi:hypothetical protein